MALSYTSKEKWNTEQTFAVSQLGHLGLVEIVKRYIKEQ